MTSRSTTIAGVPGSLRSDVEAPARTGVGTLLHRIDAAYRLPFDHDRAGRTYALDPRTAWAVSLAVALYVIGTVLAIAMHRHLFGDAAWYLVKVLADQQPINFEPGMQALYRSRWFAYHVTQWPFLWASQLGVTNLTALSWIFGATLFLHRSLSLLACWIWLKDKRLFLFPLASLFAGSINAEIYIISETHFLITFVWPVLVLLLCADLTPARRACLVAIAIPTLLAYEAMVFLGPLLMLAAGLRARMSATRTSDRVLSVALAAYFALGTVFAVCASLWPRDASNRGTFLAGIPEAISRGHLGIVASFVLMAMIPPVVFLWPRYRRAATALLAIPILIAMVYVGQLFLHPDRIDFETHVYARGMSVLAPLPLCLMFLGLPLVPAPRRDGFLPCLRAVAILGVLQCVWALGATIAWSNVVTTLRLELARTTGVIPYRSTVLAQRAIRGMPMDQLHLVWPLLPMSIVLGGTPDISSVVFAEEYPFVPFNPSDPNDLPDLSRFGVNYAALKAAVSEETRLDFRPGGNSTPFLGDGWSKWVDDWGHWTDGTRATVRLPAGHAAAQGKRELQLRVSAFVPPEHPRQRVAVSLNGRSLGAIDLTAAQVAEGPATLRFPVPPELTSNGGDLLLQFDLPDAQSPKSLGLSEDFRQLGIALVELRWGPKQ